MSQNIACPNCGCEFEVYAEFEEAEKKIADIVGGFVTPPGTEYHDVIDPSGVTYQVKNTSMCIKDKRQGTSTWRWETRGGKDIESDFLVCIARHNGFEFIFLMPKETANKHLYSAGKYGQRRIQAGISNDSWIWNYYVSRDNFVETKNRLIAARQLSLEIDS